MAKATDLTTLTAHLLENHKGARTIVAIAGAPGSGKSTQANSLVKALNKEKAGHAALLAMDGYHYDDRVLASLDRQNRKGAPDTFDVGGLYHMLIRLRQNAEDFIAVPDFDRDIEIARAGARLIAQTCGIVVVEGNYLLLNQPPWNTLNTLNTLAPCFDITVMIQTPRAVLRKRLMRRWAHFGLSVDEAQRKVDENDLPNGDFVHQNSIAADFTLAT